MKTLLFFFFCLKDLFKDHPVELVSADFNNDGLIDLACTNWLSGNKKKIAFFFGYKTFCQEHFLCLAILEAQECLDSILQV